jgi:hypothetical protein
MPTVVSRARQITAPLEGTSLLSLCTPGRCEWARSDINRGAWLRTAGSARDRRRPLHTVFVEELGVSVVLSTGCLRGEVGRLRTTYVLFTTSSYDTLSSANQVAWSKLVASSAVQFESISCPELDERARVVRFARLVWVAGTTYGEVLPTRAQRRKTPPHRDLRGRARRV